MKESRGLVYVFTGEGKGKTSAAIGTAVRAVGAGMKVAWVGFYKQASWKLSEMEPLKRLGVEAYLMGKGFRLERQATSDKIQAKKIGNKVVKMAKVGRNGLVVDVASEEEHKQAAKEAIEKAKTLLSKADVLVLDEVNNAVKDGVIRVQELTQLIRGRKGTHIVLTGRDADLEIVKMADLVTEMKKEKHPYDTGEVAVRGLDF